MILFLFKTLILCLLFTTYVNSWEGYHTELDDELPAISWKECGISVRNCDPKTTFKDPFVSSRVWGGQFANTGEYPWFVSVYVGGKFRCGGAIINEWWILTAGHCFVLKWDQTVVLRMGAINGFGGQTIIAERVVIHKIFIEKGNGFRKFFYKRDSLKDKISINQIKDGNKTLLKQLIEELSMTQTALYASYGGVPENQWDIALLKSKNRIVPLFNETHYKINSICLPKSGITNTKNESAVIIGMGITDPFEKFDKNGRKLKKGITRILDSNTCTQYFKKFSHKYNVKDNICYKRLNTQNNSLLNSSVCQGDSGSPLHQYYKCKAVQMGVNSANDDLIGYCGWDTWVVRVSIFMPWIRSVILPNDITVIISETNTLLIVSVITTSIIAIIFCFTLLWVTILALKRQQNF